MVDGQLVELAVLRLEEVAGDEDQEIAGDDRFDVEVSQIDGLRLRQGGGQGGAFRRATGRPEVGPALVVAVVAVDRGGDGVALEDAFPEPLREVGYGSVGVVGLVVGHGTRSP